MPTFIKGIIIIKFIIIINGIMWEISRNVLFYWWVYIKNFKYGNFDIYKTNLIAKKYFKR